MTRWLLCIVGIAAVALAVKLGSFLVLGRLDASEVATRLRAERGTPTSAVLCSGPELMGGVWDAISAPWATFRYSCPEDAGDGHIDMLAVTVRQGQIIGTSGAS
jgi:hypothetical protein